MTDDITLSRFRHANGNHHWKAIIPHAAGLAPGRTIRQVFYALVAPGVLVNTKSSYERLTRLSAEAKRQGEFPDTIDESRSIRQGGWYESMAEAMAKTIDTFSLDHTRGQDVQVWLGAEKRGMNRQLLSWFRRENLPVVTLGGWSSQDYVDRVRRHIEADGRPAIFVYAGDFDPSGWFIPLDFTRRVEVFDEVRRIGVNVESIVELGLVENPAPKKSSDDPRAAQFVELFGSVRQVEVEAIDVDVLQGLYRAEVDDLIDPDLLNEVVEEEASMIDTLIETIVGLEGNDIYRLSLRAGASNPEAGYEAMREWGQGQ